MRKALKRASYQLIDSLCLRKLELTNTNEINFHSDRLHMSQLTIVSSELASLPTFEVTGTSEGKELFFSVLKKKND